MRIVFMGTPAFATASLSALIDEGEEIVAVVTAPDKPAGRGRKIQESAVKLFAHQRNLPVLQPANLRSPDFVDELIQLKPDLMVVVAFRMLPEAVWRIPKYGTINIHASLLPQYRGAAPINWAIIRGEKVTGVSSFFINESIDTGDLIMQQELPIEEEDNAGTLHDKLMKAGAELLIRSIRAIQTGKAPRLPQNNQAALNPAPKIFKEDTRINFNQPARHVHNFVRGLSPYPTARAELHQEGKLWPVKIFRTKPGELVDGKKPGSLVADAKSGLKVACRDRWLEILELQISGKKRLKSSELLNGFTFKKDARFL